MLSFETFRANHENETGFSDEHIRSLYIEYTGKIANAIDEITQQYWVEPREWDDPDNLVNTIATEKVTKIY